MSPHSKFQIDQRDSGTGMLLENFEFVATQVVAIISHESHVIVFAFVVSVLDLVRSENGHVVRVKRKIGSHGR